MVYLNIYIYIYIYIVYQYIPSIKNIIFLKKVKHFQMLDIIQRKIIILKGKYNHNILSTHPKKKG